MPLLPYNALMKILGPSGQPISSFEHWSQIFFSGKKTRHWKEHRSAYSLAKYVMHFNGLELIRSNIAGAINEPLEFSKAIIEQEVRFDSYGHGREHDLGIHGKTASGKSLFVGLEAKVDEAFGLTVLDAYLECKSRQLSGVSTNAPQRIEGLLNANFGAVMRKHFDVRYQLLYSTVGTVAAGADVSVLYILVFDTPLYNEVIGAENYRDYVMFMNQLGARNQAEGSSVDVRSVEIAGSPLTCIYETVGIQE
jgi:hypothetical protein